MRCRDSVFRRQWRTYFPYICYFQFILLSFVFLLCLAVIQNLVECFNLKISHMKRVGNYKIWMIFPLVEHKFGKLIYFRWKLGFCKARVEINRFVCLESSTDQHIFHLAYHFIEFFRYRGGACEVWHTWYYSRW